MCMCVLGEVPESFPEEVWGWILKDEWDFTFYGKAFLQRERCIPAVLCWA